MPADQGYLLLADITGYTRFVASTSTEASSSITGGLLNALLDGVFPPFKVANIEGDALFLYAPDDGAASGQTVLDAIDTLYCTFTDNVCALKYGAACPSDPSLLAGALDLKLVVHYGEYAVTVLGQREDLSGADVILLHRLAKNRVSEDLQLTGYAMLTKSAVARMDLMPFFETLETRVERVEHIGEVETYVYPLAPIWERHRRAVRSFVERKSRLLLDEITVDVAVPPCRAWELCTEPRHRMQWINGVKNISLGNLDNGRTGPGAVQYCDHGGGTVVPLKVVDWRPFDYITFEISTPLDLVVRQTIEMVPIGNGTRIAIRIAEPEGRGLLDRWRARGKAMKLREMFSELYANAVPTLKRLAGPDAPQPAA